MSKVIFLDVDGTLVNYENQLPESAVTAIRKARANGHRVFISTGRSKAEVYSEIWNIGLDGMIGGNGSYAEVDGKVILHQLITAEQCKKAVDWLHARGLEFYLESNSGLFASEHFETAAQPTIREYAQRKGAPDADKMTIRKVFPEMIFGGELYRGDLNKISFVLNSIEDFYAAEKEFPELKAGTWGGKGETALFGDLGVRDISKATAVNAILNALGADKQDAFAFGDAKVDIPMLECCGTGVAMGSGGSEIKEMADYITDDVDSDGLYKAFEHFKLI